MPRCALSHYSSPLYRNLFRFLLFIIASARVASAVTTTCSPVLDIKGNCVNGGSSWFGDWCETYSNAPTSTIFVTVRNPARATMSVYIYGGYQTCITSGVPSASDSYADSRILNSVAPFSITNHSGFNASNTTCAVLWCTGSTLPYYADIEFGIGLTAPAANPNPSGLITCGANGYPVNSGPPSGSGNNVNVNDVSLCVNPSSYSTITQSGLVRGSAVSVSVYNPIGHVIQLWLAADDSCSLSPSAPNFVPLANSTITTNNLVALTAPGGGIACPGSACCFVVACQNVPAAGVCAVTVATWSVVQPATATPTTTSTPPISPSPSGTLRAGMSPSWTPSVTSTATPLSANPIGARIVTSGSGQCLNFVELLVMDANFKSVGAAATGAALVASSAWSPYAGGLNGPQFGGDLLCDPYQLVPAQMFVNSACAATSDYYQVTWGPSSVPVSTVYFINRVDGGFNHRIVNSNGQLQLFFEDGSVVSQAMSSSATVSTFTFQSPSPAPTPDPSSTFQMDPVQRALNVRFIRINATTFNCLHFRELFVMDVNYANVALMKPTTGSPQYVGDPTQYTTDMGVNGIIDFDNLSGDLTHSSAATCLLGGGWWQVDLGGIYVLNVLILFNRYPLGSSGPNVGARLANADLQLLNFNGDLIGNITLSGAAIQTYNVAGATYPPSPSMSPSAAASGSTTPSTTSSISSTASPSVTASSTRSSTGSSSSGSTGTATPTWSRSHSATRSISTTGSNSASSTSSTSSSASASLTAAATSSPSSKSTISSTRSNTASTSATGSLTRSHSNKATDTRTDTSTRTQTATESASSSPSSSSSASATLSASASFTCSACAAHSTTGTPTAPTSGTLTSSATPTCSGTATPHPTWSSTCSASVLASSAPTATPSTSRSATGTGAGTGSSTSTGSRGPSASHSGTTTSSVSTTASRSQTKSSSVTKSASITATGSVSPTGSISFSHTGSRSASAPPSLSSSSSVGASHSPTSTRTSTRSPSESISMTRSRTPTPSRTRSATRSRTPTPSVTSTSTQTPVSTPYHGIHDGCGHGGVCYNPSHSSTVSATKKAKP